MGLKLSLTYGEFVDSEATILEGLGIKRNQFYSALEDVHGVPVTVRGESRESLEAAQQEADKKMEEKAKDFDVVVEVSNFGGAYSRGFECLRRGLGLKIDYKKAFNERDFEDAVQDKLRMPADTVVPPMVGVSLLGNLIADRQAAVYRGTTVPVQSAFLDAVAGRFVKERINHYYAGPWGNHPDIEADKLKFEHAVLISEMESLHTDLKQQAAGGQPRDPTQQELDSRRDLTVRKINALLGPKYTPSIGGIGSGQCLQSWRMIFKPNDFVWNEMGHQDYGRFMFDVVREEVQRAQEENRVLTLGRLRGVYKKALDKVKREGYLGDRQHFFDNAKKTLDSEKPRAVRRLSPDAPASVRARLGEYGRKKKNAPEVTPEQARKDALNYLQQAEIEIVGAGIVLKEMESLSGKIQGENRDPTEDELKAVYRARDARLKAHYRGAFESKRTDIGAAMELYRTRFRRLEVDAETGQELRRRGSESYASAIQRVSNTAPDEAGLAALRREFSPTSTHPRELCTAVEKYVEVASNFFGNFGARILPWSWTREQVRGQCLNGFEDAMEDIYTDVMWFEDLSELAVRAAGRQPTTEELLESWVSTRRKVIERYFQEFSAERLMNKLRKEESARRKDPDFRRQAMHRYQEVVRKYTVHYDPNEPVVNEETGFPGSSGLFQPDMVEEAITGASRGPGRFAAGQTLVPQTQTRRGAVRMGAAEAAELRRRALMGGGPPAAVSDIPLLPDEISNGQRVHLKYKAALDALVDHEHTLIYLSEDHPDAIKKIMEDVAQGRSDADSARRKLTTHEINENLGFCVVKRAQQYFTEIGDSEPDMSRLVALRRESIIHGWGATQSPFKYSREELDAKLRSYDMAILNEDGSLRTDETGVAEQQKLVEQFKKFGGRRAAG